MPHNNKRRERFTKKYSIIRFKRRKFLCFDEEEVVVKKQFKTLLKTHVFYNFKYKKNTDNDKDTNDEQIKNAQNFVLKDLFKCIDQEKALTRRSSK